MGMEHTEETLPEALHELDTFAKEGQVPHDHRGRIWHVRVMRPSANTQRSTHDAPELVPKVPKTQKKDCMCPFAWKCGKCAATCRAIPSTELATVRRPAGTRDALVAERKIALDCSFVRAKSCLMQGTTLMLSRRGAATAACAIMKMRNAYEDVWTPLLGLAFVRERAASCLG